MQRVVSIRADKTYYVWFSIFRIENQLNKVRAIYSTVVEGCRRYLGVLTSDIQEVRSSFCMAFPVSSSEGLRSRSNLNSAALMIRAASVEVYLPIGMP